MHANVINRIPALIFVKIIRRANGDLIVDISTGLPNRPLAGATQVAANDSAAVPVEQIDA
jgi:hypothetical protein